MEPIFNILEANFHVILVNAHHLSKVPGRKTDQSDAQWIAELLQYGLLKASFIPPVGQRELRELTRARSSFVRERSNLVNRLQKVLESANIKLASVAADIMGVSSRAMLTALIAGVATPQPMAELAKGRLRDKREPLAKAVEGRVKAHHRFILTELLCQIDGLDDTLARFDQQLVAYCQPFEEVVALLDTIPGVARPTAEVIVAEIGIDMSRFPTSAHLAAWAGLAPGNNESAGRNRSGKTRKGDCALRSALTQAAQAAAMKLRGLALLAALLVAAFAPVLGRRPAPPPEAPHAGASSEGRSLPAVRPPAPVDPAAIRDVFRFAEHPGPATGREVARALPATPGPRAPSATGPRLVGLMRRNGRLLAVLAVDGEVVLVGPGETVAGVTLVAVGEEGVRVRRPDGTEETLAVP